MSHWVALHSFPPQCLGCLGFSLSRPRSRYLSRYLSNRTAVRVPYSFEDGFEDLDRDGGQDLFETDPMRADSDGDGLLDGTEEGVETPGIDTDLAIFIPDGDPLIVSDPLDADTDDDGDGIDIDDVAD